MCKDKPYHFFLQTALYYGIHQCYMVQTIVSTDGCCCCCCFFNSFHTVPWYIMFWKVQMLCCKAKHLLHPWSFWIGYLQLVCSVHSARQRWFEVDSTSIKCVRWHRSWRSLGYWTPLWRSSADHLHSWSLSAQQFSSISHENASEGVYAVSMRLCESQQVEAYEDPLTQQIYLPALQNVAKRNW